MRLPFFHSSPSLATTLKNKNFLKLWGSQVTTKTGENILNFSLVLIIFELTGSTLLVSALVALLKIPPILVPSFAGVIADSYDRRSVLVFANLGRAVLVLFAIVFREQAPALMVVAFTFSIIAQFFTPAESASIPAVVRRDELFTANSLFSFTNYAAFLTGYAAAGPLLERVGAVRTFLVTLGFYLTALSLVSLLPPLTEHLKHFRQRTIRFFHDFRLILARFRDGVRFIRQHRPIASLILQVTVVFAIEGSIIALIPTIAKNLLRFSLEEVSLFLILPTGVGTVIGVVLANILKRRWKRGWMIGVGLFLDGLGLVLFGLWPAVVSLITDLGWPVFVIERSFLVSLALLSGLADPFVIVPIQTTLQEWTPAEDRGRVFGILTTTLNLLGLIPILLIGLLSTVVPIPVILFCLGLVVLAVFGVSLRENRRLGLA